MLGMVWLPDADVLNYTSQTLPELPREEDRKRLLTKVGWICKNVVVVVLEHVQS